MASSVETRSGLNYGWSLGESGWNTGVDANWLRLGRFGFHLSVKDRDLATPPGSPAAGDSYIVPAGATGAWAGKEGQLAVWVSGTPTGAWAYGVPRVGWVCYVEDEEVLTAYKAAGWSAGLSI